MFVNRAPGWIYGLERDEVTGVWRKLHNEELNDPVLLTKYYSSDKIKKNEMGRARSTYGENRDVYRVLVGRPEPSIDGSIILKWIIKKLNGDHGLN